jgi:ABC-type nitrate/sulfonate/bicarbonate transport system ATPase subunit
MTTININIRNKRYPQATIISDFRLALNAGEFVCLLGPSGCGKTTLLNCLSGLDTSYEGEVLLGEKYTHPKIGYIFQNPRLLPWRTVRENIELVLDQQQTPDSLDALLDAMHLLEVQHQYPERLSLGMSRRVAIIRAFAINPDILLMDEPFVSLDAPTARQVRELLLQLWQQRPHTVLFVTHDLREAIAMADRLVFLSANPMQVVCEIPVPYSRAQRQDETLLEDFRMQLKSQYPELKDLL